MTSSPPRLRKLALIPAVAAAMLVPASADTLSDQELAKGKIDIQFIKKPGFDTPEARIEAIIDAPPQKVWRVIDDCANYKKTMPRIGSSKLLKKKTLSPTKTQHVCELILDLPMPLSDLKAVTKAIHTQGPDEWSRRWTLVEGDYSVNNGSWVLTPFDKEGTRTRAKYRLHAEPNTHIPGWIRTKAQESSFPNLIVRLREEVSKLK